MLGAASLDLTRVLTHQKANNATITSSKEDQLSIPEAAPVARTAQQLYLQDHMQRMHNEIEMTTRKLELEKRRLNKLEDEVERVSHEHSEKVLRLPSTRRRQPRDEDGEKIERASATQARPSVRSLEHRLDKSIKKLNNLLHENEEVRCKIDGARRERLQMNQVFRKLQGDIKTNTSQTVQMQKEGDSNRREAEERQHRMGALRKQLNIERKQFEGTVGGMHDDLKKREMENRMQRVAMVKDAFDRTEEKTKSLKADEEENFNSTWVMRRILKLAFLNTIQRRHIRQHQKNIEVFEQAFSTIKSTTGISDIEEIVKIFVVLEQRNFSLLTYVNELNSSIESFDKHNRELESQLQTKKAGDEDSDKKREEMVLEIKQQIENTITATQENQGQVTAHNEVLERSRPMIKAILKTTEKENCSFGGQPAPEFTGGTENVLEWLTYVEKTLTQWKDFLPEDTRNKQPKNKNYKYTVGQQVLQLQPKNHKHPPAPLVKPGELPSAANVGLDSGIEKRPALPNRDEDSSDEEEDLQNHPWTRQELRDRAVAAVAKRKKFRKQDAPGQQAQQAAMEQSRPEAEASISAAGGVGGAIAQTGEHSGANDTVGDETRRNASPDDDDSGLDDDAGPTDQEIEEIFLKRYKMSKETLQEMAHRMGIQLNNLCYLKQEFDAYDADKSGYIDVKELKGLLEKLGEDLSDEDLNQAFKELDSDNSGEIEFFEFVEWFTEE